MTAIVETQDLVKIYGKGEAAVTALNRVNVRLQAGEFAAVMGPSGCGKSTLLHMIGGLDTPTSGRVLIEGQDITQLSDEALSNLRLQRLGFIFQFYNLIPVLSALENAALPLILDGMKPADAHAKAAVWLERFGMKDRMAHRPDQLSGGQQQRVAIARALVTEPVLILADEPTGNLDSAAGSEIAELLKSICKKWNRTILMVTHDPRISAYADRIIFLKDGSMVNDSIISKQAAGRPAVKVIEAA